ncbi:DNA polymerase III subunit alpha [Candidatus Electronema sp. PJ]|uniref:DNA polymerase III subunit alpha n=1 Tax=Candidatus Electronema sp. PJ TaxID=3401572 RepID=UPI003AA9949D
MSQPFTHLHVHTQYSMLDGAIRIGDLIEKTKEYGMNAVAVTDHGAMYGALEFYTKAKKAGIRPIIGCELYIAETDHLIHDKSAGHNFHLVLLAMNEDGYRNLMKLASVAQTAGFYYKPRIDRKLLASHHEGLIALSACLHGEVPWLISHSGMDAAREKALELRQLFGDRLYFEVQENGIPEQTKVNTGLQELGNDLGIKLVATNDCHYLNKDEAYAHEVLLCIQTSKVISDPGRFKFSTDELYFKPPEVMARQFSWCQEALSNTMEVAERCDLKLKFGENHFPIFPVPAGESLESLFEHACRDGLEQRLALLRELQEVSPELEAQYRERLEMEIKVIQKMGFSGYFLIVADFINWAKSKGIPVGPGRGSGAGSLAAYCMAITDIDPIPYGLLFERFLNVERVSMPDFDVDFCKDRRDEVIDYVRQRYGGDAHVAQIVAYGSMKARAVLRDVGRVLEIPLPQVDRIAKLVPEELKITLKKAIEQEPRLRDAMREESIQKLLKVAQTLEGLARHKSTHAAGVVISPKPMVEYLPVCIGPDKEILTQYDMKYTEMTGLIKFDFLGLKTLTVIDRALKLIKQDIGLEVELNKIPTDDQKTYDLLCKGSSLGVFQLESDGMRELLIKMAPEQFTDLIALVALYRPGPLDSGMVDQFVETKHGRRPAEYPLPQIKEVLRETYGVIVYQEQVMKISNILASYSLGDADILRRAMGKKIPEEMEKERGKFMAGAKVNGIPEERAAYVFDLMAKFAGYGFNKSHSAAYALVAYHTAYLKAHYPAQFLAALLSCDVDNTDKVVRYINECRQMSIEVLPPDINESYHDFTVIKDRIRFGLAAVKGVGGAALDSVIEERRKAPYTSLADFCGRVDSSRVNRKVLENLIKAGAFDSMRAKRAQLMEVLDTTIEQAKTVQRDRMSGQMSLFAVGKKSGSSPAAEVKMPDIAEWQPLVKLGFEKETVGFFLTGHPLDGAIEHIRMISDSDLEAQENWRDGQVVRVGGLIQRFKEHRSKKGDRMAFTVLEDMSASVEVVVFPEVFARCSHLLGNDQPLIVQGTVQVSERGANIIADNILLLTQAMEEFIAKATIKIQAARTSRQQLLELKDLLYQFHGPVPVKITLHFDGRGEVDIEPHSDLKVRLCPDFCQQVKESFGQKCLKVEKRKAEARQRKSEGRER